MIDVKLTDNPAGNALTVMVKMCGVPTGFVPLGLIEILASTIATCSDASPQRPDASIAPVGVVW